MTRFKNERGQTLVLTVMVLGMLVGMTALVLDVGGWYHSKRRLQATADAAALAGAQLLPDDPNAAKATALEYAGKNGGGVLGADVTITSTYQSNDTIAVGGKKNEPGFFSRIFGVDNVDIRAKAKARVGPPLKARYVAPMVVDCDHPLIKNCDGKGSPTFKVTTTLDFDKMGAPGAFGMLNLDGGNGTPGTSEEAQWILRGFDKYLDLGNYRSDPGAKFSSSNILDALQDRLNTVLLFPVFDKLDSQGQNATYHIIGWIGFYLTDYKAAGNNAKLTGYFTEFIAQGIQAGSSTSGSPASFGVKTVQLIE